MNLEGGDSSQIKLAGVVLAVSDPDATAGFFEQALRFEIKSEGKVRLAICNGEYGGNGQAAIELRPGSRTELVEIRFEVGPEFDLTRLERRVKMAGLDPERDGEDGILFSDVSGIRLRVVPATARLFEIPTHDPLRPRRLGHVNLKTADPSASARFWQEVMGMKLSEQIGEGLYFLRIASEHHNVGLRPGERGDIHHMGFEVEGWHVYEPILERISALGHRVEYGPGRHTPGNNIFTYLLEPNSGLRLELFADMARIPDADGYEPRKWESGDRMKQTLNRWGPLPPESFLR